MFLQERQICLRTKWKDGWILSLCWKIYVKEYCWIIVVHPKCDRKTWATCLTQRCWLHELCSHFLLIYLCLSKTYTFHTEWSPFYASSRKKTQWIQLNKIYVEQFRKVLRGMHFVLFSRNISSLLTFPCVVNTVISNVFTAKIQ